MSPMPAGKMLPDCSRRVEGTGTAMVLAEAVELIGEDYRQAKWNPRTAEYVEDGEVDDQASP